MKNKDVSTLKDKKVRFQSLSILMFMYLADGDKVVQNISTCIYVCMILTCQFDILCLSSTFCLENANQPN